MKTARHCGLSALLLFWLVPAYSAARSDDPAPFPAGLVCIPSTSALNYVEQPVVEEDLKLTTAQRAQLDRLRNRLAEAESLAWTGAKFETEKAIELSDDGIRLLGRILTPEQSARHSQIVLQHLVGKFGLAQIVGLLDVGVVLDLDADQSREVQTILDSIGFGLTEPAAAFGGRGGRGRRGGGFGAAGFGGPGIPPAMPAPRGFRNPQAIPPAQNMPVPQQMANPPAGRRGRAPAQAPADERTIAERQAAIRSRSRERLFAEFSNPDLTEGAESPAWEAYEAANNQISGLLKTEQKQRLLAALGTPLASRPVGSPPAVIRGGTSLLAFPRFAPRPSWQRSFEVGSTMIVDQAAIADQLKIDELQQELHLTNEQKLQFPPITGNPDDVPVLVKLISQLLSPAQFERLQQLALQSAQRHFGPAVMIEFKEVVDTLHLNDTQHDAVMKLFQAQRQSTWHRVLSAVERNPNLRPALDRTADSLLADILTPDQQTQIDQLLGKPFDGALPAGRRTRGLETRRSLRSRVAPSLGYLTSLPENYLESRAVQQALGLSFEQRYGTRGLSGALWGAASRRGAFGTAMTANVGRGEETLLRRLTPGEEQRYFQIVMQGSVRSDGPAAIFRYRRAIDPLALTPEQEQRLLQVLWHDTRRYLATSLAELIDRLPELDRQTTSEITLILNSEQRQQLTRLLDESADGADAGPDAESPPPEQPAIDAGRAVAMRRLNYPVRHGSAVELAEILREQYLNTNGTEVVAISGANRLLIAATEQAFDTIVASLEQLDRPRQTLAVDVMVIEEPSFDPGRSPEIADGQFTGTIEHVTNRLTELFQEKKISALRKIRFEVGEDRTGSAQFGRESITITPNLTSGFRQGSTQFGFRSLSAETRTVIKAHLTDPGNVAIELTLDDTRIAAPDDADEFGIGPDGPLIPREGLSSQFMATVAVPLGEAVLARSIKTSGQPGAIGLRVIVAVRLAKDASP